MILRSEQEEREKRMLSVYAALSSKTKGRRYPEVPCPLRTAYQRDRDRIIHSKAFRRLMYKTQVFLHAESDHYRTRLTHTLEVSQIARTIARGLGLNEDLTEAIALGHDLGHTPFGHTGEAILNRIHPGGFRHNEQSLRVVDILENRNGRRGLNLTEEVRDGILNHSGSVIPFTWEGQVVRLADRIAYVNHDIDDALRSGVLRLEDIPFGPLLEAAKTHSMRIHRMVMNTIETSEKRGFITLDSDYREELDKLRSFLFRHVYHAAEVKKEEDLSRCETIIRSLYEYFCSHPDTIAQDYREEAILEDIPTAVKDYIAGMTDRFAYTSYDALFSDLGRAGK